MLFYHHGDTETRRKKEREVCSVREFKLVFFTGLVDNGFVISGTSQSLNLRVSVSPWCKFFGRVRWT